jgi:hypothetical protein
MKFCGGNALVQISQQVACKSRRIARLCSPWTWQAQDLGY